MYSFIRTEYRGKNLGFLKPGWCENRCVDVELLFGYFWREFAILMLLLHLCSGCLLRAHFIELIQHLKVKLAQNLEFDTFSYQAHHSFVRIFGYI